MDLTEFERAKNKLARVRLEAKRKEAELQEAQRQVNQALQEIGRAEWEVHRAFLVAGGVLVNISTDQIGGNDPYGPTKILINKSVMMANGRVAKFPEQEFKLSSPIGDDIQKKYRIRCESKGAAKQAAAAELFNALLAAAVLRGEDKLVVCEGYFINENGVWRELE